MKRDVAIEAPVGLAGLVQVQSGAVVSRTLLSGPSGSVTLFGFDAGEALSEHTTPQDALVLVLEGEAEISVGSETNRVESGEVLHLPAGVPHALYAEQPFKMLLVMLRQPPDGHT